MTPDLAGLGQYREGATKTKTGRQPVDLNGEPQYKGRILSFDQSISDTGWAVLDCQATIRIGWTGMIKTEPTGVAGWGDYLTRVVDIYRQIENLFIQFPPDLIAFETPPMGARLSKPESSLVASVAITIAGANQHIPVVMKHRRHIYSVVTGNANATKAEMKRVLLTWRPQFANTKPFNEHVVDAVAVGVIAALEESHV